MTENRRVSHILKALLDNLGLHEEQRQRRMTCQKMQQVLLSVLPEGHSCQMLSGSAFETTTIDGLSSDIDVMFVSNCDCWRIIADIGEWRDDGVRTFLMDSTGCYKAFVKLYLLSSDYPGYAYAANYSLDLSQCNIDEDGRYLLRNSVPTLLEWHNINETSEVHGPALTMILSEKYDLEQDNVFTFRCDSFPKEALGWKQRQTPITRTRIDPAIIDNINHCYLVAVGNKNSPTEHVEWRLSFSHIENELVHAWNNVQYQCYVLMKFIQKDLIKPAVPDALCSYHFKTLVMWMNEEYQTDFFTVSNFDQCALMCLKNLAESVRKISLPHYFVDGCNLFYPKLTNNIETSQKLNAIITTIIEEWPLCLFAIRRCRLGDMFRCSYTRELTSICSNCKILTHAARRNIKKYIFELWFELFTVSLEHIKMRKRMIKICLNASRVFSEICELRSNLMYNEESIQFIDFTIKDLLCNIGLQWIQCDTSESNKTAMKNTTSGLRYIQRYSNSCCIDTGLKIAAHYVKTANCSRALIFLNKVESQIKSFTIFHCLHPKCAVGFDANKELSTYDNKPSMTEFCTHYEGFSVTYNQQNISHVPKGLVYEMFRSTSVSPLSDPRLYDWHSEAIIHCPVYLYYLQFIIHQKQRRNAHRQVALDNMEWAAKELSECPGTHRETNHNIIGHCHRSTGDTRRAYKEYRKSLEIEKYNNAVLWHLAVLLRSQIRGEQ